MTRLPFDMGMAHYDPPPPDVLGDLEAVLEGGTRTATPAVTPAKVARAAAGAVDTAALAEVSRGHRREEK